jgi:hypothetical protein
LRRKVGWATQKPHSSELLPAARGIDDRVTRRTQPAQGARGDLAYVGIAEAHPAGLGATTRRKPRCKPRPEADIASTRAFARRRVVAEHPSGRRRRYGALTQPDRHHRRGHPARARAAAGLVNRQLRRHRAA